MAPLSQLLSSDFEIPRHCALCQKLVAANKLNYCGRCVVRAYCSEECLKQDWKSKDQGKGHEEGQGHKNWCGFACAEQDLDFSILPVKGKGQGLVAKRTIPPVTRIVVEGHAEDISQRKTFAKTCAALKVIRYANHACDNNAEIFFDGVYNVSILVSKREIAVGEEITVNYLSYNENFGENRTKFGILDTFTEARKLLKSQWGITCPRACFCKTQGLEQKLRDAKELFGKLAYLELADVMKLLKLCEELKGSLMCKGLILRRGLILKMQEFGLLADRCNTVGVLITLELLKPQGLDLMIEETVEAVKILGAVRHPENEDICYLLKEIENWARERIERRKTLNLK